LNVTPDSFSDGGKFSGDNFPQILEQVKSMFDGVEKLDRLLILDIGGESTRPGAAAVPIEEELNRVIPVIQGLVKDPWFQDKKQKILISVDTWKSEVAEKAILAGANMINDVSSGRDPKMLEIVAQYRVPIILMHSRGDPQTMSELANYEVGSVVATVGKEISVVIQRALEVGIFPWHILTDVGIGFAKKMEHNLEILRNLNQWKKCVGNYPLVVGTSRKSFIGKLVMEEDPANREFGTAATITAAIYGGAHLLRVHDVGDMAHVIKVTDAILKS